MKLNSLFKFIQEKYFFFFYIVTILFFGLSYFFDVDDYGEPYVPTYFKLLFDLLYIGLLLLFLFNIKGKYSIFQIAILGFLTWVVTIGFFHLIHLSVSDYLHYSIRNVAMYSLIIFLPFFDSVDVQKFEKLHIKLFWTVLIFGFITFALQKLQIPQDFRWMWGGDRMNSTWRNPNSLSFYLLFYYIYFLYKKKAGTTAILTAAGVFLTGSLTAIMGLLIFTFYYSLKNLKKLVVNIKYVIILIFLLPAAIYILYRANVFDYVLFKIDVLFYEKSSGYTSVSTRTQNIIDLYNYLTWENILSVLIGDLNTMEYRRLDSQYLNIFYNYGLIGLALYSIFQLTLLIKLSNNKSILSKAMFIFNIWLFFIGFNLTAYLYRSHLMVFYFIMILVAFKMETILYGDDRKTQKIQLE